MDFIPAAKLIEWIWDFGKILRRVERIHLLQGRPRHLKTFKNTSRLSVVNPKPKLSQQPIRGTEKDFKSQ